MGSSEKVIRCTYKSAEEETCSILQTAATTEAPLHNAPVCHQESPSRSPIPSTCSSRPNTVVSSTQGKTCGEVGSGVTFLLGEHTEPHTAISTPATPHLEVNLDIS